jgi:hypothetical protein
VEIYASDYDISVEEASRRLDLQNLIGKLNARLETKEADTFAGLWVEHEPEFRVYTRFTRDGDTAVRSYTKGTPLEGLVEAKAAESTLEELKAAEYRAARELEAEGIPADSALDVKENEVETFVAETSEVNEIRRSQEIRLPEEAAVIKVPELSQPAANLYGGRWLYLADSRLECTAGFAVKHRTMGRGIITAGHCAQRLYFSYERLRLIGTGRYYGSYDVQWHKRKRNSNHRIKKLYWNGNRLRPVRGVKGRNPTFVGERVCKYGWATGRGCGIVRRKNYRPGYVPRARATFMLVRNKNNRDLSSRGDSGGPVFYRDGAYGIVSGSRGGTDLVYMPINYIGDLGLRVLGDPRY